MTAASSVVLDFERLQRELASCLAEIFDVAKLAATTRSAAWRAIVEAMTGQSPALLPPAGNAANPAEVRHVLLGVQAVYERRLRGLEHAIKNHAGAEPIEDAVWTFRHRRLDRLVADELAAYIKLVTPRPSVADVFARAANVSRPRSEVAVTTPSSAQLHRCKTCAAPRLRADLYGNCVYCGHPFFTGREEIY